MYPKVVQRASSKGSSAANPQSRGLQREIKPETPGAWAQSLLHTVQVGKGLQENSGGAVEAFEPLHPLKPPPPSQDLDSCLI